MYSINAMEKTMSIKEIREIFVKKWVKQLSKKLQKPEEDLLLEGLRVEDFKDNVYIEYEDGSSSHYKYAFYIENDTEYAVFTEHCGYHEFNKDWLNNIEEYPDVNIGKLARIKWIGDGNAYVEIENERLYANKLQLKSLHKELGQFINYYSEDFAPSQLILLQNLTGIKNLHEDDEK